MLALVLLVARELSKAALGGEELLRALAMFGHRFSLVGVDTGLSVDLVKLMFQAVSILIHGVVNNVIDRWVSPFLYAFFELG